jgi:hypothetical protein
VRKIIEGVSNQARPLALSFPNGTQGAGVSYTHPENSHSLLAKNDRADQALSTMI